MICSLYPAQIVLSFKQPAAMISGLEHDGTNLWAASQTTKTIYKLNPVTGAIISSFKCELDSRHQVIGLGYGMNALWVGQHSHGDCFVDAYTTGGQFMNSSDIDC